MRKAYAFAVLMSMGIGHASAAPEPTPTCVGQLACERMWLQAQEAAETLSGSKLRIVTETRIETFPPQRARPGITVLKRPLGGGKYEIQAKFACLPSSDCETLAPLGTDAFNSTLNASRR